MGAEQFAINSRTNGRRDPSEFLGTTRCSASWRDPIEVGVSMTTMLSSRPPPPAARSRSGLRRLFRSRAIRGGRHRDVQGSAARAAVLGAGDGLITNISLVLGVAGASTNASAV